MSRSTTPSRRRPMVVGDDLDVGWSLKHGDAVLISMPRGDVVRQHLSHLIHHRGQLTVYLRLVDVPLPPIYGPTADEPWGGAAESGGSRS